MKELTKKLVAAASIIVADAEKNTKAAHARIRRATLEIAKLGKEYRKASIAEDKAA